MLDQPGCRVYLIRHGKTANTERNCFNGHFDVELSACGLEQMREISQVLRDKPIRAVYSSDLRRTVAGARLIAEPHGIQPVAYPELRELSVGKWEGLSVDEVNKLYPGEIEKRFRDIETSRVQGGETIGELQNRALPKFLEIVKNHPRESIAMVCHGGVNRTILYHLLEIPLKHFFRTRQDFACINMIQFYDGNFVTVELLNGSARQIS